MSSEHREAETLQLAAARRARMATAVLLVTALAHVLLVATHAGDFWPFSLYPMFSRAGRPWQRALVRHVPAAWSSVPLAHSYTLDALPGEAVPLDAAGVPQNDLSSLVQRADLDGESGRAAAAALLGALPCRAGPLLLLGVRGALDEKGIVEAATPLLWIDCEGGGALARVPAPIAGVE